MMKFGKLFVTCAAVLVMVSVFSGCGKKYEEVSASCIIQRTINYGQLL